MDADRGELRPDRVYRFEGFTLDPARAALLGPGGAPRDLRPKSFEVLCRLVAAAGGLVTREALMRSVWPGTAVTDESITQCVRDVRRALGDAGQRLVRTVPKRGYMLLAEVSTAPLADGGPAMLPAPTGLPLTVTGDAPPAKRAWRAALTVFGRAPTVMAAAGLLLLGGILGGGMAVWRTGAAPAPPGSPPSASASLPAPRDTPGADAQAAREEAQRLFHEGTRRIGREWGASAWLAHRELFARAIAADPGFGPAWSYLAFTYANMVRNGFSVNPAEDLRAAEVAAERGLALAPETHDAHSALGSVLRLRPERLEAAAAAYRRALELSPNLHHSRANLGWVLVQLGRAEEGEALIRTSLAAATPEHAFRGGWHYYIGMTDLLLGRDGFGLAELRRAFQSGSTKATLLGLAAALALAGQQAEAGQLVAEARRRWPHLSLAELRADPPSRHPAYLELRERFLEDLALAGLP